MFSVYWVIALPYLQNDHFDEAASYLEKAVKVEPTFGEAWNNLAACYGQMGRHLMENVLYTDLVRRGFDVDVGVVEYNTKDSTGKSIRKQLEVDFVINRGSNRFYIQSALDIADLEKKDQETAPLRRIPDSFRKIVVVGKYMNPWNDDYGIQYVGIEQFLTNESILS